METISPIDWGPIYKETLYGRWPVEPWNTATTLFFLVFVIFWALKIKPQWKTHLLLVICLPIIFIGFVGGFLYHSNRDNPIWLVMDWGPIALTAVVCCTYYWRTLLPSWGASVAATFIPLILIVGLLKVFLPRYLFLSLGYPLLAFLVLTPLFVSVRHKTWSELRFLFYAILCVCLAITLRFLDKTETMNFLPMGSDILWNTVGALTCHFFAAHNYENPPQLK